MSDHVLSSTDGAPKARRQQQLIDAAIACIHQQGLEGTTVAGITRAAKLPAGSVRSHFGTKDRLLLAVQTSIRDEFQAGLAEAVHGLKDPEEILDRIIGFHFDLLASGAEKTGAWCAFSGTRYVNGDDRGTCGTLGREVRDMLGENLSALCRQMPGTGLDPTVLARGLEGMISTCLRDCLNSQDALDPADAAMLCRTYLASLFPGRFSGARPPGAVVRGERSDLLPRWTYRNPEFFGLEMEHLFKPGWMLAGHVSDVAQPGAYLTFDGFGERALVIRGDDGRLRAFHNVCRHRGALLLNQPRGHCSHAISCPFHGWTYDTRGNLISVPARHTFGQLEMETKGLVPLELEIWMGFVFVRFRTGGASLKDTMAPVEHLIEPYRVAEMMPLPGTGFLQRRPYNWKIIHDIDNEGYHVPVGHPALQQLYGPTYRDDCIGDIPVSSARINERLGRFWSVRNYQKLLPGFDHLPEENQKLWLYLGIFPNMVIGLYPDSIEFYMTLPITPDSTWFLGRAFALPDDRREVHAVRYLNRRINYFTDREDEQFVRAMQDGLRSSAFPEQTLSDKEQGVRNFHKAVQKVLPVARLADEPGPGRVTGCNAWMNR